MRFPASPRASPRKTAANARPTPAGARRGDHFATRTAPGDTNRAADETSGRRNNAPTRRDARERAATAGGSIPLRRSRERPDIGTRHTSSPPPTTPPASKTPAPPPGISRRYRCSELDQHALGRAQLGGGGNERRSQHHAPVLNQSPECRDKRIPLLHAVLRPIAIIVTHLECGHEQPKSGSRPAATVVDRKPAWNADAAPRHGPHYRFSLISSTKGQDNRYLNLRETHRAAGNESSEPVTSNRASHPGRLVQPRRAARATAARFSFESRVFGSAGRHEDRVHPHAAGRSVCRDFQVVVPPASTRDEQAVLARYTVNIGLTGPGGSLESALAMMQAGAAIVRAGGCGRLYR